MRVLFVPLVVLCLAAFVSPELSAQSSEQTQTPSVSRPETDTAKSSATPPGSTKLETIKRVPADYPIQASMKGIQGEVILSVWITETGDVERAEFASGDKIFADSAIAAVKKWKFKPYIKNGKAVKVSTKVPFDFAFANKTKDYPIPPNPSAAQPAASGDPATQSASPTNPAAQPPASANPADQSAAPATSGDLPKRVRVSQGVAQGMILHKVAPVYPELARRSRIEGTVLMKAIISREGDISELTAISGPRELIQAAMGAVRQWRYRPYLLQGQPVEVETQIVVNFTLSY
ncbi:MAG TPA: TonB family protein [Terriglobales bacterium]|jgi:TonB family protein|nr:TonB family protein [Terriglobales bacterium]